MSYDLKNELDHMFPWGISGSNKSFQINWKFSYMLEFFKKLYPIYKVPNGLQKSSKYWSGRCERESWFPYCTSSSCVSSIWCIEQHSQGGYHQLHGNNCRNNVLLISKHKWALPDRQIYSWSFKKDNQRFFWLWLTMLLIWKLLELCW